MYVKSDDSIDDRPGRYFHHGAAGMLRTELGGTRGTVGLNNDGTVVAWPPMKGIGGAKKGDLRGAESAGEMHGGGIDGKDKAGGAGECGESEEVEPAAEVALRDGGECLGDGGEVGLLMAIGAAGEDAGHLKMSLAPFDDLSPAVGGPVFLGTGGAGMDEDEGAGDAGLAEELAGLVRSPLWEVKDDGALAADGKIEGTKEMEVVIDGVIVADGRGDEFVVKDAAESRALDQLVGDAAGSFRENGKKGGAVGGGEIEAGVVMAEEEVAPEVGIVAAALIDEGVVDVIDGGNEFAGAGLDGEDDVGLGEVLAKGPEGRRGEDEIANPLQLQNENPHGMEERREAAEYTDFIGREGEYRGFFERGEERLLGGRFCTEGGSSLGRSENLWKMMAGVLANGDRGKQRAGETEELARGDGMPRPKH
jgi:hypothetical protein